MLCDQNARDHTQNTQNIYKTARSNTAHTHRSHTKHIQNTHNRMTNTILPLKLKHILHTHYTHNKVTKIKKKVGFRTQNAHRTPTRAETDQQTTWTARVGAKTTKNRSSNTPRNSKIQQTGAGAFSSRSNSKREEQQNLHQKALANVFGKVYFLVQLCKCLLFLLYCFCRYDFDSIF